MPVRQLCSSAEPGATGPCEAQTMDRIGPPRDGVWEKRPKQSGTQYMMGRVKQEENP